MGSYAPTVGSVILLHRLSRRVSNDRRSTRTTMSVVSDDPPKIESFQRAEDPMDARASPRGRSHNLAIRRNLHLGLLDDLGRHRIPWPQLADRRGHPLLRRRHNALRRRHASATAVNVRNGAIRSPRHVTIFFPLVERAMNEYADDAFDSRSPCVTAPQPARLTTRRSVSSTTPIRHRAR